MCLIVIEMLYYVLFGILFLDVINNIVFCVEDKIFVGDNFVFLKSKFIWDVGKDGKERVLDVDGNG